MKQFENLKTLLKNAKSQQGQDLFAHLQDVFKKLIMHYPDQALDKLEEVSYLLKKEHEIISLEDFLVTEDSRNYSKVAESLHTYLDKLNIAYYKVCCLNVDWCVETCG